MCSFSLLAHCDEKIFSCFKLWMQNKDPTLLSMKEKSFKQSKKNSLQQPVVDEENFSFLSQAFKNLSSDIDNFSISLHQL